jgi:hypothetical protein
VGEESGIPQPSRAFKLEKGVHMTTYMVSEIGDIKQLDITAPAEIVEVQIREDKKVIWVNVDGVCCLRICQIPKLKVLTD